MAQPQTKEPTLSKLERDVLGNIIEKYYKIIESKQTQKASGMRKKQLVSIIFLSELLH